MVTYLLEFHERYTMEKQEQVRYGLLMAIVSCLVYTANCQASCGYHKVCALPGSLCKDECNTEGTFTCTCPASGETVVYNIACQGTGQDCSPSSATDLTCDKFINCATCKNNTGELESGCETCSSPDQSPANNCSPPAVLSSGRQRARRDIFTIKPPVVIQKFPPKFPPDCIVCGQREKIDPRINPVINQAIDINQQAQIGRRR